MRWGILLLRFFLYRIRFLCYIAFIGSTTLLFYWIFGGFDNGQSKNDDMRMHESQPSKADSNYPAMVKRYCNMPLHNESHDPISSAAANLRLRGLVVITRHGDRAPLLPFPQHLDVPRCGLWDMADIDLFHQYRSDLTVVGSNLPVHQSASSSFGSFLTAPANERCRPGHLTAIGVVQHIRLGRALRQHYQTAWSFPSPSTECNPRSTVYPRTYQSALAFLYGWTGGADGKVKSVDGKDTKAKCELLSSETTYFCNDSWCMCPNRIEAYHREYHDRMASFTQSETKDKDIRNIVQKIASVLETPKLVEPLSAFDTLMGYACHREPPPCNHVERNPGGDDGTLANGKQRVCVAKEWLIRLYNEGKNAEVAAMKSESGKNLALVQSVPIMTRLSTLIDQIRSGHSSFEYFSGHDITLRPLLAWLGLWDGYVPPYASYLAFELIEDTSGADQSDKPVLYFRVLYNGNDVTAKVSPSICKDSILSRYNEATFKLCLADGLKSYAKNFVTFANGEVQYGDEWVRLCR